MSYLSDFQRCQIIGDRLAGVSVSETSQFLGASRSTVSKVMTAYAQSGKISSVKHKSERKERLGEKRLTERSMPNRYPSPASLPELSQHLHEEWRIQAALDVKGGPTLY
ncbi:hypothetical protein TNCV_2558751 [Trichonephila clavipes]|nr:hypothetical protein TNCV_2558751 [Trichonephila clavipes]